MLRRKHGLGQDENTGGKRAGFLAKPFMEGNNLKRDFPYRWCTRKASKVVTPWIARDFHTPFLLHSLSIPAVPSLHGTAGFFSQKRGHPDTGFCRDGRGSGKRKGPDCSGPACHCIRCSLPAAFLPAGVPQAPCRSCFHPYPPPRSASLPSRRDLLHGECGRS